MRSSAAILLALTVVFSGCATAVSPSSPAAQVMVDDRLTFGRNIPAGGEVSAEEWDQFVRDVVTPRFPEGFTILTSRGQWLGSRGEVVRENGFVIEILHAATPAAEDSIAAIATEYRRRFHQDAVLRATSTATVRFY